MIIIRAPVRISFGGGGTDLAAYYERWGGFVISAAVTRYAYVVVKESPDGGISLGSADYRVWETHGRGELPLVAEPLQLPKGALAYFAEHGLRERGIDLFSASEAPPGTGLGSSSAMAVALVRALAAYLGLPMSNAEVAETACHIEIERLGMPIGKQDQYASALGGLNALTFRVDGVGVEPLPISRDLAKALSDRLLLFSTGQARNSATILREQRADTSTKPAVVEGLHQIKALAGEMRQALLDEDLDRFGLLLHWAWQHKKQLSNRISSGAINGWYDAALRAGALGGKITGAGGGGFFLLYCPPSKQTTLRAAMTEQGLRELTFDFDWDGVRMLAGETIPNLLAPSPNLKEE